MHAKMHAQNFSSFPVRRYTFADSSPMAEAVAAAPAAPSAALAGQVETLLSESDSEMLVDVLTSLARRVDAAHGKEAEAVGEYLRGSGAIARLATLVAHPDAPIHQVALLLIGNLASEAVDANASRTKKLLKRHVAFPKILKHIFSDDWMTLVYSLGAIQNTCNDTDYVELIKEAGAAPRLQHLASCGDLQLEQFAKGTLSNIRQVQLRGGMRKAMLMQARAAGAKGSAADVFGGGVRGLLAKKKARPRALHAAKAYQR